MKNTVFTFVFLFVSFSVFCQVNNWKNISVPFESDVSILLQTDEGVLLGNTISALGQVISYDNGLTWSYLPKYIGTTVLKNDNQGNFLYLGTPNVHRVNVQTLNEELFNASGLRVTDFYSFVDSFVVVKGSNGVYTIDKLGNVDRLTSSSGDYVKILTTSLEPLCYVLRKSGSRTYLHKINSLGEFSLIRELASIDAIYYLHGNTLIRDTEYSNDEGLTWTEFDIPIKAPNDIFNYNGNIAFAKGNKIYSQNPITHNFDVITLPIGVTSNDIFVGKTIVAKTNFGNRILRNPTASFESILFNLATPEIRDFAAGKDEQIVITNNELKAYIKADSNSTWRNTGFTSFSRGYTGDRDPGFSYNKDNILTLFDTNSREIKNTSDGGQTWTSFMPIDSTNQFVISEKEKGTFWMGDSSIQFREIGNSDWETVKIYSHYYHYIGVVSNYWKIYSKLQYFQSFVVDDTTNSPRDIIDIPGYNFSFDVHYEMNYVYSSCRIKDHSSKILDKDHLSRSYDNGITFKTVQEPDTLSQLYFLKLLWSGHLLQRYRKGIYLSNDYGKSWMLIPLELSDRDHIQNVVLSPDNYLYVLTAEKGILKYLTPLPMANIIRFNIKEDLLGDCNTSNDINGLENIKVSLDDQATQITDQDGNAVFYTFRRDNKLIIHNDSEILDICQDTIPVVFADDNGLETNVIANTGVIKQCPNLSLKFVNYQDSITNTGLYKIMISNNGNKSSPPAKIRIELDPFQYISNFDTLLMEHPSELVYLIKVDSLKPGESYLNDFYVSVKPNVPFDKYLCISAQIIDYMDQCTPNEHIVLCNDIKRIGGDKTIAIQFYHDKNGNCIQDFDEPYIFENLGVKNNSKDYYISTFDSVLYIQTEKDVNFIEINYNEDLYTLCQDTFSILMHQDSFNYTLNVPLTEVNYCSILKSSFGHITYRRCFETKLFFQIYNSGNIRSGDVNVEVNLDGYFDVLNVSPLPLEINGNQYLFDLESLDKGDFRKIEFSVNISCDAPLGYLHCNTIQFDEIDPSCNFNDSENQFCRRNVGSFDPNDKTIYVSGEENKDVAAKDDKIEYRIRFQNTGTDTAYSVRIEDYLSSSFELSSIKMIHSTHSCNWKVIDRLLMIDFPDINLVDSFTNALASQGEILFEIVLSDESKIGDSFSNKASIFFDRNEPIITNEVVSTIGRPTTLPYYPPKESGVVNLVPNPTKNDAKIIGIDLDKEQEVHVFSTVGTLLFTVTLGQGENIIEFSTIPSGTHIILVDDGNSIKYGKLVKI